MEVIYNDKRTEYKHSLTHCLRCWKVYNIRTPMQTTTTTAATRTSQNKRFNGQNNPCARALKNPYTLLCRPLQNNNGRFHTRGRTNLWRTHRLRRTNRLMCKQDEKIFRRTKRLIFGRLERRFFPDDLPVKTNKSTTVRHKFTLDRQMPDDLSVQTICSSSEVKKAVREMTKFCFVYVTWTITANFSYFHLELNAAIACLA